MCTSRFAVPESPAFGTSSATGAGPDHMRPAVHRFVRIRGHDSTPSRRELVGGRVVGGSSAVNACYALRGSPADYDDWATRDNPGWSFDDVLPTFRAPETDADFGDHPWHGTAGPLPIMRYGPGTLTGLSDAVLASAVALGHEAVADHNRPWAVGARRCRGDGEGPRRGDRQARRHRTGGAGGRGRRHAEGARRVGDRADRRLEPAPERRGHDRLRARARGGRWWAGGPVRRRADAVQGPRARASGCAIHGGLPVPGRQRVL